MQHIKTSTSSVVPSANVIEFGPVNSWTLCLEMMEPSSRQETKVSETVGE